MNSEKTLVIIQSPPTPDLEALDIILSLAAFEIPVSVLFIGAGRLWLCPSQEPRRHGGKNPSKALLALPMYGCTDIFYAEDGDDTLIKHATKLATPITQQQCQHWMSQHAHCLSF